MNIFKSSLYQTHPGLQIMSKLPRMHQRQIQYDPPPRIYLVTGDKTAVFELSQWAV